jgi:hypothetical protein
MWLTKVKMKHEEDGEDDETSVSNARSALSVHRFVVKPVEIPI